MTISCWRKQEQCGPGLIPQERDGEPRRSGFDTNEGGGRRQRADMSSVFFIIRGSVRAGSVGEDFSFAVFCVCSHLFRQRIRRKSSLDEQFEANPH